MHALLRRFRITPYIASLILLVGCSMGFGGCSLSKNPVTGKKRALAYSWEEERQIGAQADQQIRGTYGFYDDDEVQAYVDRVGQRVLAESHLRRPDTDPVFKNTPVVFRVLDSPVVNAFALPGGYVYVTRGLLYHLENEAQLAVVLGHEIGHVAARHASQRAFEQQLGQIGLIGGAILGQEALGLPAGDLLQLGGTATQLLFLSYSRGDERESDELGVEYAARAGYAAAEGSEFFRSLKRIGDKSGQSVPGFLSTHPDPGEREQRIVELARQYTGNEVDRDVHLNAIEGIVLGENPRQGFEKNNVFYHPDLRFQFPIPSGWKMVNQASQVVLMEPNQRALVGFTFSQANSPQAAASEFAQQQGLQVVDSGRTSSNGMSAYYVVFDAQTQQGGTLRGISYFVEYDGQVYSFLGYTQREQYDSYENDFLRTMRGFDNVTDRSVLNVQPRRVAVESVNRRAPFQQFVDPGDLPTEIDVRDMAIINQTDVNTTMSTGRRLKLSR